MIRTMLLGISFVFWKALPDYDVKDVPLPAWMPAGPLANTRGKKIASENFDPIAML